MERKLIKLDVDKSNEMYCRCWRPTAVVGRLTNNAHSERIYPQASHLITIFSQKVYSRPLTHYLSKKEYV